MTKKIVTVVVLLLFTNKPHVQGWGFWGHERINRLAVFTLPPEMMVLYKENIDYLTVHSTDPDKRRYSVTDEAPRHYIDLEFYDKPPYKNIPRTWNDAVAHFGEMVLNQHGIVPWYVVTMFNRLVDAFKEKNKTRILRLSAEIGHYIADAHVPLHCTQNYNGQLTGQTGIHGFWESRIPELFGDNYDYFVGKSEIISSPREFIWNVVFNSASEVDSVLLFEKKLSEKYESDKIYGIEMRGNMPVRAYSVNYSKDYETMLDGMVEKKMRASIIAVGSFWYSAWVMAAKPPLVNLTEDKISEEEQIELSKIENAWKTGKIIGREE